MTVAIVWVTVALAALLVANWKRHALGVWITKPLASAGFVYAAVAAGATATPYGRLILLALALSFAGDVLLIPKASIWFKLGLLSFLLAHLAFGTAFAHRGIEGRTAAAATLVAALLGGGVYRWLAPHLPGKMKIPVAAYIVTIVGMVGLAIATTAFASSRLIPAAAVCFFVSDLSVARDRFVEHGFVNRLWGLPLYYAAQLLFAFSVRS